MFLEACHRSATGMQSDIGERNIQIVLYPSIGVQAKTDWVGSTVDHSLLNTDTCPTLSRCHLSKPNSTWPPMSHLPPSLVWTMAVFSCSCTLKPGISVVYHTWRHFYANVRATQKCELQLSPAARLNGQNVWWDELKRWLLLSINDMASTSRNMDELLRCIHMLLD